MKEIRSLLVEDNQKTLFRMYKGFRTIGSEIKKDLFGLKSAMEVRDGRFVFHMNDGNRKEGLLSQTYGLFLLSVLNDRFETFFNSNEIELYKNSVISVIDYVEKNGFDVTPFSTLERNRELFSYGGDAFIESVTWVLSCLMYARRLQKKMGFDKEMPRIIKLIAYSLKLLLDNVICADGTLGYKDGYTDYIGWGPVTGCRQISLYFSHSVCESFGDLEDTALGNEEIGVGRDEEFIEQINEKAGKNVVGEFVKVCECVGENMYKKYEKLLGKNFFYADESVATYSQISCSIQSPVLLNQLYVILSAIYTNYYKRLNNEDKYKDFMTTAKNAVDMVYEAYIDLKSAGRNATVDRDFVTFAEKHPNKLIAKYLAGERINVSILEALIVKAKTMIVTYVSKYPEKEIDNVIDVIEDNHMDGKWIWSDMGFDLQQTERCISAIREFYDYYEVYVSKYAKLDAQKELVDEDHRNEINTLLQTLENEKKRHEEVIEALKVENEKNLEKKVKEVSESNFVDAAVIKLIDNTIEERITETISNMLLNIYEDSKESAIDTLTPEQKKLKDSIKKLIYSFLIPSAQKVKNSRILMDEWSTSDILNALEKDFKEFLVDWMAHIAGNNRVDDEKIKGLVAFFEKKS